MAVPARGRGAGRGGRIPTATKPVTPTVPAPAPIFISQLQLRLGLYNTLTIPTKGQILLTDLALYAFQHYALFTWLVTHTAPTYPDGPSDDDVTNMITRANALLSELQDRGPSSIYLILKDGYTKSPLKSQATERLIILALIAERPQLIPKILRTFPETSDPLRLADILRPYTDSHLENYASQPPSRPDTPLFAALWSMANLRMKQNLLLRDAVTARYLMVAVIADPYIFGKSSLGEITALVSKIETTQLSNKDLYLPLTEPIEELKRNFAKVQGVVNVGAAITQDSLRRLKLLLGVLNATDNLLDKMTSGTGIPAVVSTAKIAAVITP